MTKRRAIGDLLHRVKLPVDIEDKEIYKRLTIRTNHKGVSVRDTEIGMRIGTKKQFLTRAGDFILSKIDARQGAFGIVPAEGDDAIITGNFWTYRVDTDEIDTEWFLNFTNSPAFIDLCKQASTGNTHRKYLNEQVFLAHQLDVPDIHEQITAVENYKSQAEISESIDKQLAHQQMLLAQLKQAILQAAIRGELTADWRKKQGKAGDVSGGEGDSRGETADQLLQRIATEKHRLVKAKKLRKQKPLPPLTPEETPFDLPEGWTWCRVGNLCEKTGSGSTPSGGKSAYVDEGVPFLRSQNVHNDGLRLEDVALIPQSIHERMEKTTVFPDDLLLNITGGSIGRCAVVRDEIKEANVNQHVAIIRPVERTSNVYMHSVLLSPYFQRKIFEAQTGAGREGLPKNKMDVIPIPLPPLAEQSAIVSRVESLMSVCRSLESEVTAAANHAAALRRAVLQQAFAPAASES